jgi:DNA-binding SARP family transcriptional activator
LPVGRDGGLRPAPADRDQLPAVVPAKVRAPLLEALPRERLESILAAAAGWRLALVIAPAGSGKTTLLARMAATFGGPVAWYRAEALDRDEPALVRHLEAALLTSVPGLHGDWRSVDDVIRALEARSAGRTVLVVDDFHALEGSAAETAFGRLVDYAPDSLSILIGGRVTPGLNLPRLRVAGDLLEIGPDDLRFRSWEVEDLYRDIYHDPVPPGILAELTRRTEGWAAGLQLFHLASAGKPADERRRLLASVGSQSRTVREYLARNVLAELPPDLGAFLRETCVLGRLSGPLCDRLRGATGSESLLEELVRRGVFTAPVEGTDGTYRYHEVLRSYLDRLLMADVGEVEARARYAKAAALLEAEGALTEALTAWSRAEDWTAVDRLLRGRGERLVAGTSGWVEQLPPALVRHEPWLMLAAARKSRADGRWSASLEWYERAEAGFVGAPPGAVCRQERMLLASWLDPAAPVPAHWTAALRSGLQRDPAAAARDGSASDEAHRSLVRGLLWLASGHLHEASRWLLLARETPGLDPSLDAAAALGLATVQLLGDESGGLATLAGAVELAERAGASWLAALGRRIAEHRTRVNHAADRADTVAEATPAGLDDPWGVALGSLAAAWFGAATMPADWPGQIEPAADAWIATAEAAAKAFRRLGAGVLESWARALAALAASTGDADTARETALSAVATARSSGTSGARLPAYRALELVDTARAPEYARLAEDVEIETGLTLPGRRVSRDRGHDVGSVAPAGFAVVGSPASRRCIQITTLGGYAISVDDEPVDLSSLKPRARALLRLLSIHAPAAVHREVLQDALWPDGDAATGARSLQVCVSAIRGVLAAAGPELAVVREGDAYRLVVPEGSLDLRDIERAAATARDAESRGEMAAGLYRAVAERLDAELLPEDGPADWVVERREQLRAMGVAAALSAARAELAAGNPEAAAQACRAGLALDRYHDPLWRLLIDAHDRAGDAGAASRDRRQYEAVLAGLGVGAVSHPPL